MVTLLIDGSQGVYIPKIFADSMWDSWVGLSEDDRFILLEGPDNEDYYETWFNVMCSASRVDEEGNKFYLYEDEYGLFSVKENEEPDYES